MRSKHVFNHHRLLMSPHGVTSSWDLIIYNALYIRSPSAFDAESQLCRIFICTGTVSPLWTDLERRTAMSEAFVSSDCLLTVHG